MKLSTGKAFLMSLLGLVLVGALGLSILKVVGVPFAREEQKVKDVPKAPAQVVSQLKRSPAWSRMNKALTSPPRGWEGKGEVLSSPQSPYPFSCDTSGINPAISVGRLFSVGGEQVQVVTTAYTAGLGYEGMKKRFESLNKCQGGGASSSTLGGLGEESYQVDVNKSNSHTKDIVFRDGDLVTYVVTSPGDGNAYSQAKSFRDHLMKTIGDTCAAPTVSESDAVRNPYGRVEYKGYWKNRDVKIEKFPLPKDGRTVQLNEDGTQKTEEEQKAQQVKKPKKVYKLDPQPVDVPDVTVPEQPTEYPVWPLLPAPMDKPVEPVSPGAQPVVTKVVQEQVRDSQGPGCGWDFTGSVEPEFDDAVARVEFTQKQTAAKSELRKQAQQWQKDVLNYWSEYNTFETNLSKWNKYSQDVNKVSEAWDRIRHSWEVYYADKEVYDNAVQARKDFIAEKERAAQEYPRAQEICRVRSEREEKERRDAEVQAEKDAKEQAARDEEQRRADEERQRNEDKKKPSPSATSKSKDESKPKDDTEMNVSTQANDDDVQCPAERPAILDQEPPTIPKEPTPPADPRPVDAR